LKKEATMMEKKSRIKKMLLLLLVSPKIPHTNPHQSSASSSPIGWGYDDAPGGRA
jgi:hypothetical protein